MCDGDACGVRGRDRRTSGAAPLKIAIDARELAGRPTGVGRYLSELLAAWILDRHAVRHEWRLYAHAPLAMQIAMPHTFSLVPGDGGSRWEQWTLGRRLAVERPDVLFAPGYTAPLTAACPTVLTIHDVSFAAHPEWFSTREGLRRRVLTRWSARRARVVLTDTQFSRNEIIRHLGTPAARIQVIPLGMRRAATAGPQAVREPIVLFVGSIFARRHVDRLIGAFVHGVATRVGGSRLEIIGENRATPQCELEAAIAAAPADIASRVAIRSYVDEATLAALYRRASVFAFLSEYEGFGLTPLEALAAGVPIIVLDTPVAREVYGPAARYVTDLSPQGPLADALVELLTSDAARSAQLAAADEVLARYDWRTTAAATLRALEDAAGIGS
jgi:glycosyltransferase involved in cell wall biosynthesis